MLFRGSQEDVEVDEDLKRDSKQKKTVVDKDGKTKEVDIYDRPEKKKKDPDN